MKNRTETPAAIQDFQDAVAAGYWIAKDHGKWNVGAGSGSDQKILARGLSKSQARERAVLEAIAAC